MSTWLFISDLVFGREYLCNISLIFDVGLNDWSAGLDITGWRDSILHSVELFNLQVFINRDNFCLTKIDSIGSALKRMYTATIVVLSGSPGKCMIRCGCCFSNL